LSHAFETEPPVPFLNGSEYVSNAARIAKRCLISVFFLLIVSLAAFLSLIYFKASAAWFYSAGALCAIFSLLTIRLLLYLANSIIISHGGIFKHNSFK
jgi:membrane protein YdbS with pleckstrin-like domain